VGCAWRILDRSGSQIATEGTSLLQYFSPPNTLSTELNSIKYGILTAIQSNIKRLKVFTNSNFVSSILSGHINTYLPDTSVHIMELIIEINELKKSFQYFEIDYLMASFHTEDLRRMVENSFMTYCIMKKSF
jgi:hypothetical protein